MTEYPQLSPPPPANPNMYPYPFSVKLSSFSMHSLVTKIYIYKSELVHDFF